MKSLAGFTLKMFLMKTVFAIVALLMLMFILVDITSVFFSVVIAIVAVGVYMLFIWDYASRQGTKDAIAEETVIKTAANGGQVTPEERSKAFKVWKGFAACFTAALPMIVLNIICAVFLIEGNKTGAVLQNILVSANLIFSPIFGLIPMPNINMDLNVIPSLTTMLHSMMNSQTATLPYITIIPELLFFVWGGISYLLGKKFRQNLKPNTQPRRRLFRF